ncbi:MAG TPA: hypothetical protein VG826_02540 [Pirellulales bacterium]|nr:hypothetical protein [Pirellulales bacterium]
MSGPKVLLLIHIIGCTFIWLWFVGSCSREGLWNNAITFLDSIIASFVTIPIWIAGSFIAAENIQGPDSFYLLLGIVMAIGWVCYLVSFAIIHAITDRVSKTKVSFHPLADKIGSALFAMSLSGVLLIFSYPILAVILVLAAKG